MSFKNRKVLRSFNRFRVMLTLPVAAFLPAAALIYVNFSQLKRFERDKVLEAAIHRDFQETLALTEKRINKKAYSMVEDAKDLFPAVHLSKADKEKQLDKILAKCSCFTHLFLVDPKDGVYRTRPDLMSDKYVREEHERNAEGYPTWFRMEGKTLVMEMKNKPKPFLFYTGPVKRAEGEMYTTTALFAFPLEDGKFALGGASFDPYYLKNNFFPQMLDELIAQRTLEDRGNPVAMSLSPAATEGYETKPILATSGWNGKPEVTRKLDDIFRPLALGIRYQGTSVKELGESWIHRSFWILGILSLLIVGGLALTKHIVSKEMALARLKSDFVSNVSHELRTPLALIRLYAETLELGRITTQDKKEQYYRIIRKESERLTALINNILDFSRIEAGRKEYEFQETNLAELVRNTLDSYRYQIEQQGFELEESIDRTIPPLRVDREAIARALVNLINNALKYSDEQKFLGVKLYRANGAVKLEVLDHGIGIDRHDQAKIFEKFYRAGDPLVHNTKGSGLGLSLVRHISQAHGGDIVVDSIPGKGSKFTLSLPVSSTKEPLAERTAEGPITI